MLLEHLPAALLPSLAANRATGASCFISCRRKLVLLSFSLGVSIEPFPKSARLPPTGQTPLAANRQTKASGFISCRYLLQLRYLHHTALRTPTLSCSSFPSRASTAPFWASCGPVPGHSHSGVQAAVAVHLCCSRHASYLNPPTPSYCLPNAQPQPALLCICAALCTLALTGSSLPCPMTHIKTNILCPHQTNIFSPRLS